MAAHGAKAKCLGEGTIKINSQRFQNSVHVKDLSTISILPGHVCDNNDVVVFTKKGEVVLIQATVELNQSRIEATTKRRGVCGLYRTSQLPSDLCFIASATTTTAKFWHQRLDFASKNVLDMAPKMATRMNSISGTLTLHAALVFLGRLTKNHSGRILKQLTLLAIVPSDVFGPLLGSIEDHRYFRTFWISFLGTKRCLSPFKKRTCLQRFWHRHLYLTSKNIL